MVDDAQRTRRGPTAGDGAPEGLLTLHQTADMLHVHYMTAYRWVRAGELSAFKVGNRLRVRRSDLDAFLERRRLSLVEEAPTGASRRDWARHRDRLYDHLVAGRSVEADEMVRTVMGSGATAGEIYLQLLTPVMRRVGAARAAEAIDIAHEKLATTIVAEVIARLSLQFRGRRDGGTAVVLGLEGERHSLGTSMVADFVRAAGWRTYHLGVDVPFPSLRHVVEEVTPDLVVVSATNPVDEAQVAALAAATGDVAVVVGGLGSEHLQDLPPRMRVTSSLPELREMLTA